MICQPAWQLAMITGLPSASGCSARRPPRRRPPRRAQTSSIVWSGIGLGQEADEVAGMAGRQRDADLAVLLHAADAGAVAGARVDHDERSLCRVDRGAGRRNDAHQHVVDGPRQGPSVADELEREAEHVGRVLGALFQIGVAALAQHIEEQDRALPGIDPVFLDKVQVLGVAHPALLVQSPVEGDTGQASISSLVCNNRAGLIVGIIK